MLDVEIPLRPPLRMRFEDAPPLTARFFEAEYGRMRVAKRAECDPDLSVRFVGSLAEPDTWESLGQRLTLADDDIVVIDGESRARISVSEGRIAAEVERSMPVDVVRRRVVVPAIALLALARDAVVVHASATLGPHGNVLLLGDTGAGKTCLLLGLLELGHHYIADDLLLLDGDCRLTPLQGLLELRLDILEQNPRLRTLVRSSGWRQARALRSTLRAGRRVAARVPTKTTRRIGGTLRPLVEALDSHCFFVDPEKAFGAFRPDCHLGATVRAYVVSRGAPNLTEPVASEALERHLRDSITYAHKALFDPMARAARISPRWNALFEDAAERQRRVVESASACLQGTRVRISPEHTLQSAAQMIARLEDQSGA